MSHSSPWINITNGPSRRGAATIAPQLCTCGCPTQIHRRRGNVRSICPDCPCLGLNTGEYAANVRRHAAAPPPTKAAA